MTRTTRRRRRPALETLEGRALLTAGALDTTFGGTGMVTTAIDSAGDYARGVAIQPDSKVVAVGLIGGDTGPQLSVVRYNADGSLDTTFGKGGTFIDPFPANSYLLDEMGNQPVALQSDGKIVVAGSEQVATTTTTTTKNHKTTTTTTVHNNWTVFRLNPNGTLDTSFGNGGQVLTAFSATNGIPNAVAIQPDGKIVLGGYLPTSASSGHFGFALQRYNPNGTLDTSFGSGGQVVTDASSMFGAPGNNSGIQALALDSSGRIIAVGIADVLNGIDRTEMAVFCYTPSGVLDTTFGQSGGLALLPPGGYTGSQAVTVGLQPGGQIVVGGSVTAPNGINGISSGMILARLTPVGALDSTFGPGGSGFYPSSSLSGVSNLAIQSDGKIVAVGYGGSTSLSSKNFFATRVLADGTAADPAFGSNGVAEASFGCDSGPTTVALDPFGRIVIGGGTSPSGANGAFAVARFLGDPATTSTALVSSASSSTLGQPVTFTATINTTGPFAPTGTVEFYDGTTLLGTATLVTVNGVTTAVFTTSVLASGVHNIRVVYDGDADDLTSASGYLSQVVT